MLFSDLKSSTEVVCQLLEETIQTVTNGGLTKRQTVRKLPANSAYFVPDVKFFQNEGFSLGIQGIHRGFRVTSSFVTLKVEKEGQT